MTGARSDPFGKLPWEFHLLGYFPEPWTITDSMAICRLASRIFGEREGRELRNLVLYQQLVEQHGLEVARSIFDDLRWQNDPDAPVTVPSEMSGDKPGLIRSRGKKVDPVGSTASSVRSFPNLSRFNAVLEAW